MFEKQIKNIIFFSTICQMVSLFFQTEKIRDWEAHVSELSRRCMGLLIGLSHVRHYLPDGVIKIIMTVLVISRVNYCPSVCSKIS